jgi:AcrR family transcriptional regulator
MDPPPPPSPHLNPPQQTRSRRTLERIVRAATEILAEEGPDALTVKAIVERADASVGSFYARFPGKDELLEYLGERVWTEAAERFDAMRAERRWDELDLPAIVEGAVTLLAEAGRSRASHLRALDRAGRDGGAFAAFREHVLDGVAALLLERRDEIRHPDPERAVQVGLLAVVGLLDAADRPGRRDLPPELLTREAARLLRSYLTPDDSDDTPPPEGVEFFDVWG